MTELMLVTLVVWLMMATLRSVGTTTCKLTLAPNSVAGMKVYCSGPIP
jgi:hypothetical protein